jgi:hypothetical protein
MPHKLRYQRAGRDQRSELNKAHVSSQHDGGKQRGQGGRLEETTPCGTDLRQNRAVHGATEGAGGHLGDLTRDHGRVGDEEVLVGSHLLQNLLPPVLRGVQCMGHEGTIWGGEGERERG